MTKAIAVLTLFVFLAPIPAALARGGGNNRSAIDQERKRAEASQKMQNELFERLEREADGAIMSIKGTSGSDKPIGVYRPSNGF